RRPLQLRERSDFGHLFALVEEYGVGLPARVRDEVLPVVPQPLHIRPGDKSRRRLAGTKAAGGAEPHSAYRPVDGDEGARGRAGVDVRWRGQWVGQVAQEAEQGNVVFVPGGPEVLQS